MAERLSARTNHHFYLAKLMLRDMQHKLNHESLPESLLLDAWGQAVVWHLRVTFQTLVKELADKARRDADQVSAIMVSDDLDAIDNLPAELRELATLQRSGWLADLMTASREEFPVAAKTVDPLSLAVVSNHHYGVDELTSWFKSFDDLIDRFRESMVEC